MINPINPGLILPLYPNRLGNLSTYHNGYGILASNTNFINFHFKIPGVTSISSVTLIPVSDGEEYRIPNASIRAYTTGTEGIFFYDGSTLADVIVCGLYELRVLYASGELWSDFINVKDLSCGYQRAALRVQGGGAAFSVEAADISTGAITSSSFLVSTNGGAYVSSGLPFSIGVGNDYSFIRKISTSCGSDSTQYVFESNMLTEMGVLPSPEDVYWKLTVSYDQNSNGILYEEGYTQVFYFSGPLSGLSFDDSPERLSNGQGQQFLKYAETRDLVTVTASGVSDAVLSGLYEGKHKEATLQRVGDSNTLTTKGYEIAVSPATFNHFNTVALTFERAVYTTQFCEPEFVVTPV